MTHATDQRAAQARDDADAAVEAAGELPDVDRERQVAAVAVGLLHQHSPDRLGTGFERYALERLAWLGAELAVRADVLQAAEPEWPPAAADIRAASDFPGFGG